MPRRDRSPPLPWPVTSSGGFDSAEQVVAARRIENQEAAAQVGADTVNFSIPDCIYRRSPTGELLYPDGIFVPIHPREKDLDATTAIALASELQTEDVVVSPLAVGGHIDHVFTRRTAERLNRPLRYYADIPYLLDHPEMLAAASSGLDAGA